ncbi:MAG: hypothetical protein ACFFKA_18155 [Candidatus Thorarchaeota archaeon]
MTKNIKSLEILIFHVKMWETISLKAKIFFYITIGFTLIGLLFPTHLSQAIGFDIGDMIHWVYGFYILIPRNPPGEPKFFISLNIQGIFLLTSAFLLLSVIFVQLHKVKLGKRYDKNLIYIFAIIQLISYLYHEFSGYIVVQLSSWAFLLSAVLAIIGNRELKISYIDKNIVNRKRERTLGIVLFILSVSSLAYTIFMILIFGVPYGLDFFSFLLLINIAPGFLLLLILLFYGIYSLIRAKQQTSLE